MPVKLKDTGDRRASHLHLQSWLRKRSMTAEELAARLDTSKSVISKLLNGRQRYNQDWLERIAFVLDCEVAALLRDADKPSANELLDNMSDVDRDRSINILKAMVAPKGRG